MFSQSVKQFDVPQTAQTFSNNPITLCKAHRRSLRLFAKPLPLKILTSYRAFKRKIEIYINSVLIALYKKKVPDYNLIEDLFTYFS